MRFQVPLVKPPPLALIVDWEMVGYLQKNHLTQLPHCGKRSTLSIAFPYIFSLRNHEASYELLINGGGLMDRIILKLAMPILFAVIFILTGTAEQVQAKNVGASVNGHGNLVMDGTLRTFSFHAREFRNGDVEGSFELKNRLLGVRGACCNRLPEY